MSILVVKRPTNIFSWHFCTYFNELFFAKFLKITAQERTNVCNNVLFCSQAPSRAYKVLEVGDLNIEDSVSPRATKRLTSADDHDIINDLTYQRISVGLMEDPDIQKVKSF